MKNIPDCFECGDLGIISAERDNYEYVFACVDCFRGINQPPIVTRWGGDKISLGYKRLLMWWDSEKEKRMRDGA